MRQSVRSLACVGLFVALAFGCAKTGGDPEEDSDPTLPGATAFCEGYCERVHSCDEGKDESTCTNACTNANAATLPKIRADVVDLMSSCIEDEDCKTVLEGGVVLKCADEAAASVAPSDAATSYCQKAAKAAKKCGRTVETAACLENAKLYNDKALADATDCTEKACADVDECIAAALGTLKSTSTGTGSGSGSSDDSGSKPKPSTGDDDDDDDTTTPSTCSGVDTSTVCGACQASECCSETKNCGSNQDCLDILSCLQQCSPSDSQCPQDCADTFPAGIDDINALGTCLNDYCSTECQ